MPSVTVMPFADAKATAAASLANEPSITLRNVANRAATATWVEAALDALPAAADAELDAALAELAAEDADVAASVAFVVAVWALASAPATAEMLLATAAIWAALVITVSI